MQKSEMKMQKEAAEKQASERKAVEEKAKKELEVAAEKQASERKAAEEKAKKELEVAAEKQASERKAAEEKAKKELEVAAEKQALERKAVEEKAKKELEVAAEKQALERKAVEEKAKKELEVAAEKQALERKAVEEKANKELELINKEKENAIKVTKAKESEQGFTKEKLSPTDKRSAPYSSSEEEVEKKKQKKETEPSEEKHTSTKITGVTTSKTATDDDVYEDGKHAKKKGGKTKKTSESDSGFHNDDHDTVVTNDVLHVDDVHKVQKPHGKHKEVQEKTKSKKSDNEFTEVANGDMAHNKVPTHINESASPLVEIPSSGSVVSKNEYKPQEIDNDGESNLHSSFTEDETSPKTNEHMGKNGQHKLVENHMSRETISTVIVSDSMNSQKVHVPTDGGNKSPTPIHVDETVAQVKRAESHTTAATPPTQFAQNVEKLVTRLSTKMEHDAAEGDPSVKTTLDAQLNLLSEKKSDVSADHRAHLTTLPLEHHVSRPMTPLSRDRLYKLLPKDIIFCSGLIDSHGEDYAAMAADPRNVYKENARGIQRKIRIFKESPHYQTYLRAKNEGRPIEEILAEESQT
ncbi:hypothetical protein KIN20_010921 [Parelaphostrongylus tenuis]|uniref:Nucleolar protein 16 n=1 Tax=Parelaphostrongylus tenuis TaxID=148309 RepID=A0AAD5QJ55_PARTN|nr:hypothetical protein KIN20_010921 [Parelaphostrongylus tenuis]